MSNPPEPRNIGQRLRAARELAGLSQGQVARILGVHRPTISEIEAGRRRVTADELLRFSEIYDVPMRWIAAESVEDNNVQDERLELAARELARLKPEDLERLLRLLEALRHNDG